MRAFLVTTLALAAVGAGFVGTRPDLVLVERVEFVGAENADIRSLRHLAGIQNGTTMWEVDLGAARLAVLDHPWVRRASVDRVWPDTVRITIEERTPVALLDYGGMYYVDEVGVPFLQASTTDLDYPTITGIDPALEGKHPDLPRLAVRDALGLLRSLSDRKLADAGAISQIDFSPVRGYTVTVGRSRVVFGLEGIPRQLDRLALLQKQGLDLTKPTFVDLAPDTVAIVRPLVASAH